jgi:hypothetical protein
VLTSFIWHFAYVGVTLRSNIAYTRCLLVFYLSSSLLSIQVRLDSFNDSKRINQIKVRVSVYNIDVRQTILKRSFYKLHCAVWSLGNCVTQSLWSNFYANQFSRWKAPSIIYPINIRASLCTTICAVSWRPSGSGYWAGPRHDIDCRFDVPVLNLT